VDYFVYAVGVLLLCSLALFIKHAVFNRRPQKIGLIFALLAVPLFVVYYSDRSPWDIDQVRTTALDPLTRIGTDADINFTSDVSPAIVLLVLILAHLIVIQRLALKERLVKVLNPIATFLASAMFAAMFGGIIVTAYHRGWIGSLVVGVVYTLVYLGVLAILASLIEILVELVKLFYAWFKRWVLAISTLITRFISFVSSLAGRLGLTNLAEKIRQETATQENIYAQEQEMQDRELYAAYVRDRARQRRAAGKRLDLDTTDLETLNELARQEEAAKSAAPPPSQASAAGGGETPASA
jgi:sensor histidine kinase YesM